LIFHFARHTDKVRVGQTDSGGTPDDFPLSRSYGVVEH